MVTDGIFKSMTDPIRRRILQVLLQNELGVSELVNVLGAPQSTVSRHLKTLRDAGLVDARQSGTSATYFPLRGQNGPDHDLRDRVLDWSAAQHMPTALKSRLDAVLRCRQSDSNAFFSQVAHRWDAMRTDCFGSAFHLDALTALLPADWTVVDVGCGTGYLLPLLAQRFAKVIAVDPVDEMLEVSRERLRGESTKHVTFRKGSATHLHIEDNAADLCIASLVLHHEPMPPDALAEFCRILKPGGRVLIIEQEAHSLTDFHEMMQDRWWGFDRSELCSQLADTGFEQCETHDLQSVAPAKASTIDAPGLFALTGRKQIRTG
jgi:ArsR family transcriptional regulator